MEFWERNFIEKQEMWGDEAAKSTTFAVGFFFGTQHQKYTDSWVRLRSQRSPFFGKWNKNYRH